MKLNELQDRLRKESIDAALFWSIGWDPQIYYLTGYAGVGTLLVPSQKPPCLIVPLMEAPHARGAAVSVVASREPVVEAIKTELNHRKIRLKRIGVDSHGLSVAQWRKVQSLNARRVDVSRIMMELRSIKTKKEIQILKEGCRLTDRLMEKAIKHWRAFSSEADVAAFLEYNARKNGCQTSFSTIIASGRHAGVPHHETQTSALRRGLCVMDFGIRFKGYCTDISRTVCIGSATREMEEAYQAVLAAQERAIDAVQDGVKAKQVDDCARKSLGSWSSRFTHGLGHGIGVQVHEPPWLNQRSTDTLQEGMAITIEPGVYTSTFGVRIEDDILITARKPLVLTRTRKDLVVLD